MKKSLRNLDKFTRNELDVIIRVCNITNINRLGDYLEEVTYNMKAFSEGYTMQIDRPLAKAAYEVLNGRYGNIEKDFGFRIEKFESDGHTWMRMGEV